ncbi:MAG: carbohydrate kinase family protein [Acidobacteria bacterium]|nr:carbohydrate kinase family protein [Acidobacteriota bacterium]
MSDLENVSFGIKWPENRSFQLVGLGLNAVDWICVLPHFPRHNTKVQIDQFYKRGGGQVATAAALCARYGLEVRYVGRVGDDEIGKFSLEDLQKEAMELSCVQTVPGTFSQFAVILTDRPTGERTILWDRDPALHYKKGELKREWIVEAQLLHLDGHDQPASIQAARWAKEAGMKVSLDIDRVQPGVEELLALTDFLIPGTSFLHEFSANKDWRKGLRVLSEATSGFVAVTRGKEGVAALWEGKIFEIPGIAVNSVDTTGAGDVFHGAFLHGLFQGWSVGYCLRFANVAGALSCTQFGARGGIPPLQKILSMLNG